MDEVKQTFTCSCPIPWTGEKCAIQIADTKAHKDPRSCNEFKKMANQKLVDGEYPLRIGNETLKVYCHMTNEGKGWTLIARFSNADIKNWRQSSFWRTTQGAMGATNPDANADMISPAFWLVSGSELKVTLSNDSSHTPLLQTTGDCLGGRTFRSKVESYGKGYVQEKCLGNCTVEYGGQYKSTEGFQQTECSGEIQSANNIGFLCYSYWEHDYLSMIMIGGGGKNCSHVDHGLSIRAGYLSLDFGDIDLYPSSQSYALNLWVY
ncbi:uncharacterized protein LOC110039795 [Orbicella faveolata]|uniref:uncharacterized protein LOC110039795 n=1 Tax=Orbicella faveolata TaxID=48498 RepID=UPI0009E4571D|nr:uncharacterized protein LOC110039795 [Orbicella faveolata]